MTSTHQGVDQAASRHTIDGTIAVIINLAQFAFHVDAAPGYDPTALFEVLQQMAEWGLEPLDDDIDGGPEMLTGGVTRIWFMPIEDVDLFDETDPATKAWVARTAKKLEVVTCPTKLH